MVSHSRTRTSKTHAPHRRPTCLPYLWRCPSVFCASPHHVKKIHKESLFAATCDALEQRLAAAEDLAGTTASELETQRRRAASQERAAADRLEQAAAAHQEQLREAIETERTQAREAETRVLEAAEAGAVAASASAAARRELAEVNEAAEARDGEASVCGWRLW